MPPSRQELELAERLDPKAFASPGWRGTPAQVAAVWRAVRIIIMHRQPIR